MNRNSCAKRLLSLLLCLTLILGLLPNVALAADADGVRYQENADVAVTYDDVDRTHATVRYHKPGAQVDSYNIIFLVDTSVQGKDSFESFEKMMVESGSDTIFDSTSNNLVSLINYTTTAETNRVNNDGIYALMSQVIHGAGTANEITALDAALAEVKSLKNSERSSYPTIVFWVLGKELVEVGNAAFESKLKALHDALNMDGSADTDALITWQLGTDTPNELLKQYATEYTGTHDSVPAKAAYASSNAAAFRKAMRDGLENIAYDHYHDLTYKLELSESNNGTSIVKKVTDVYVESARGSSQIMATPSKDNKSVAVQIEHLRRQTDYDIVFELDLNADVYEAQTVLQGITIDAQSAGQSGGVHTGVFDELTANLSTTFPEAVVDRAYRDISFDLNGGTGDAVEPIKALPGQRVVLPDGRGLARGDESFGGWNAADTADQGKIYRPGSVLEMPENGMELKAAYGHMEVELDVEKVATSTLDNHLDYVKPPRYSQMNGILTSVIPTSYWAKIVGIYVDDRTFNRYSYNKSTREVDVNTLVADDLSIVAAWHLGTIQDDIDSRVIGYLTPNGNYYDLHIAGPDGVIAPENSAGLFEHPLDQNFYERVTTIHLDALNTENVKDMNDMFSERTVLTELKLGPNFVTKNVTNVDFGSDFSFANGTGFNDMFNGCTSLKSVSGLNFNTSNKAAGFNNTFKGCSKLESVTFVLPERNASFPSLKTMTDMFDGCNQLTNVDFGGTWTVGDLTNTNRMFRNCTSLKNITLDFDEIRATQDGFFTTDMFTGVPADATLTTTVSMTNGLQAIRDAFDSRSTRAQTMDLPADLDEDLTEQWPADNQDVEDPDDLMLDDFTEESMDELLNRSESSITLLSGSDLEFYADDVNKPTASDANITVHPTATKVGDKVTYRIRAKYVGDNGAQSSLVDIALPLPEFMTAEPDKLDIKVGNLISDGAVIKGGYVVGEPEYDAVNKMLRAKINALASSCYIDFNITYTIDQNGKNVGDYYYWDATALAVSENGSVNSNTYRLWQAIKADPNPGTTYQFKYEFTGDIPADVTLPAVTSRTENEQITVASAPMGYPSYYTFTGWKRSDTGAMIEPGTRIEMPADNLTLTGIWTLNQANVPEVTVQYQYTGSVPADAPAAPDTSTAKVTSTYYPNTNALHSYSQLRYKLGNTVNGTFTFLWRPTLTIDGTEVALTTSDNGKTYTDNANTYRIPASDVLDLEQFRTAAALGQNIVITYTAAWEPFRGTVQYNANGGKYTAAGNQTVVDRANVAFNEAYTLKEIGSEIDKIGFEPYADNISFLGWSTAPSGGAILSNDANPASLIKTDGQVITLYARWYVNNVPHGVALNLANVTAEDQQTTAVLQGASYTNKLTVKSGYIMKTVSVLMGETDITERAYNASTGEINIAAVTGDVIITATAEPDGSNPNPPTPKPDDKDHDNRPRPNPTPTPVEPSVTDPKVTGVADLLDTETHVAFMHGYDTGYFGPNDSLTRAQACQMFYNLLLNKDVTVTTSFSDVSEDAWYYTAVNALASLGIVRGIGNSKFEPERSITRAEFTAIATRFAKADNRNALKFRDVSTDDWFYGCVLTAVNYGWITGMDEYTFQPNEKISRAQAAAIVNRMLARSADQSYTNNENVRRFPDVPTSHWAFYQVMEASNGHGHSYDKNGSEIWTELYEASSKAS